MEIITGRTGTPHVYAADDAEIYRLFLGDGDFRLTTGNQFLARMNGTQQINIYDGSLIMQGRLAKIRPTDAPNSVSLDIGTTGYKRVDIIVAEYSQTVETRQEEVEGEIVTITDVLESVELKVVKGTNSQTSYIEPAIITGNIDNGETHQTPLWAVRFDGINNDGLIDKRPPLLDTTPIQTALDYARGSTSSIDSIIANYESSLNSELSRIRGIAGIAPLTVVIGHDITSSNGVITVPSATYTYTSGDVFVVYLNGLRAPADSYTVSAGTNALVITTNYNTSVTYDDVEIEVWRPSA